MYRRNWIGRPRITFTRDFRELVRGDLVPGRRVVLRYDPLRIVPPDDGYVFGDPTRPVTAHAGFHRDGREVATVVLASPGGVLRDPDIDVTGAGSMLRGELDWRGALQGRQRRRILSRAIAAAGDGAAAAARPSRGGETLDMSADLGGRRASARLAACLCALALVARVALASALPAPPMPARRTVGCLWARSTRRPPPASRSGPQIPMM
jgi:hypothetical protein